LIIIQRYRIATPTAGQAKPITHCVVVTSQVLNIGPIAQIEMKRAHHVMHVSRDQQICVVGQSVS
jgi:hypothetical protein